MIVLGRDEARGWPPWHWTAKSEAFVAFLAGFQAERATRQAAWSALLRGTDLLKLPAPGDRFGTLVDGRLYGSAVWPALRTGSCGAVGFAMPRGTGLDGHCVTGASDGQILPSGFVAMKGRVTPSGFVAWSRFAAMKGRVTPSGFVAPSGLTRNLRGRCASRDGRRPVLWQRWGG